MSETYRWTTKNLDDLEIFYREEILPTMVDDGLDPDAETPAYSWLVDRGYSGFIDYLKREYGLSPEEFYAERGLAADEEPYWNLGHPATEETLDEYVDELANRRGHPETTVRPIRSRLKKYGQLYADVHGTGDLLSRLSQEAHRPEEISAVLAVFDVLDATLGTVASKFKYLEDTRRFYQWLVDVGRATYNPLERLERRFGWNRPEWDNPALSMEDVTELVAAADGPRDELLVVALTGWGLRPSEVAALRAEQFVLDPEDDAVPYLKFEEGDRKNGPGTVSLLVGASLAAARIRPVAAGDDRSDYLFPSTASATGHVTTDTIRRWFRGVATDADVAVRGSTPTPKHGRRFWYSLYGNAVKAVAQRLEGPAADQGSDDAAVVLQNYLSERERRKQRRDEMRRRLDEAFKPL